MCGCKGLLLRSGWLRILPRLPPRITIGYYVCWARGSNSSEDSCAHKHLDALFLKPAKWGWGCLGGQ